MFLIKEPDRDVVEPFRILDGCLILGPPALPRLVALVVLDGQRLNVRRRCRDARTRARAYPSSDRKSTRLNSSHSGESRMPSSA